MHDEIVVFEVMPETLDAGGGGITDSVGAGLPAALVSLYALQGLTG